MNLLELSDDLYLKHGDYQALFFEGRWYSSFELRDMHLRIAGALQKLGVEPNDRVAVMTPNCPEVGATYAGCWRIGAVPVPILFLLAPPEVKHILTDCEPKAVITSIEFLPTIQQAVTDLAWKPEIILIGSDSPAGTHALDQLLAAAEPREKIEPRADDELSGILYTGGTTGRPKGVMLTHGGMVAVSEAAMALGEFEDDKVGLGALPLAHGYGILTSLIAMRLKGRGVLMRWFIPDEALRLIEEHRVQLFAAVPTMLVMILNHPDLDKYDLSSLERVSSGAAPCPLELMQEFERRFGVEILEGYGLTESTIVCCSQRRTEPRVIGSVGKAWPGFTVEILDDDNNELPQGELGEICIKGPNVMKGYYNLPDKTAEVVRDGWLHSGDIGRQDAEGNFYVVERKKDLIIRGGLNIYPRDVEEVLFEHPAIAEAAVIGKPDPQYGEDVVAFVVRRAGKEVSEDEVLSFCREKLAKYKSPKEVVFVDSLPKSGVGKVLRRELREMAVAR